MGLREYKRKRKFQQTPEPKGKVSKSRTGPLRFVVQMHDASRLHFDLRLEFDGVFKSWAVPKGPSLNPQDQRLAVFVEDHPLEYGSFEGIIPSGNYGAGTVMLWDEGTYVERSSEGRNDSEAAMRAGLAKGHLTFVLTGHKLNGEFALIKLKKDRGERAWLLVKKRDEFSSIKRAQKFESTSVKTGRTMSEIAAEAEKKGDVWRSKRKVTASTLKPARRRSPPPAPKTARRPQQAIMPRKNKPMLATQARTEVPSNWWLEPHIHGLRALAEVDNKRVNLYSRSGLPYNQRFPQIAQALTDLKLDAVLDGEIAQQIYHVFDVLYANGEDLRELPLSHRRKFLNKIVKPSRYVQIVREPTGQEAVIAKNPASPYRAGTSNQWLMIDGKGKGKTKKAVHDPEQATLTHPEKVYFPEDGFTKSDVYHYYEQAAEFMLPYLIDRPESLNRHPNGIHEAGFYQKDMTGHIPRWFKTKRIFSESSGRSIDYPMVQDQRSLLYIANLGCIEIHPWFSRVQKLNHPDFLVIDLDPDDNPFPQVVEVAHAFHELLDEIDCANFCKTSGATGIHIGIPTGAKYSYDTVRAFAEAAARIIQKKFPALTSMERTPARRRKKIYLDCLQNRRGQTLAAPFCIRPKSGAPVSMPLTWKELTHKVKPQQFNIENALSRMRKFSDPWRGILGQGVDLVKCAKRLEIIKNRA